MTPPARKLWLALECAALFIGVPLMVTVGLLPLLVIPLLLVITLGCGWTLQRRHHIRLRDLWHSRVPAAEWRRILALFLAAVPGLTALLWLTQPDLLFALLRHQPKLWLLVLLAYPLISVLPQEFLYRAYFFARYAPLFGRGNGLLFASATVFAFGHLVFHNWPAVGLTLLGGCLFAKTYQRTSSLMLAAVEHALYGCAIFTLGYGQFFLDGTLRLLPSGGPG